MKTSQRSGRETNENQKQKGLWTTHSRSPKKEGAIKLHGKAFALSWGILWGLGLFVITWWIIAFEGAAGAPTFIGRLYRGYAISPAGSFIGRVWALVQRIVGGAISAWLYNLPSNRISDPQA